MSNQSVPVCIQKMNFIIMFDIAFVKTAFLLAFSQKRRGVVFSAAKLNGEQKAPRAIIDKITRRQRQRGLYYRDTHNPR